MATWAEQSLARARPAVFWNDTVGDVPEPSPLVTDASADLVIVGGGFTGLWAAVLAAEADPGRSIAVVEAERVGFGASSRNGGFCEASLTHGPLNGLNHWPDEIAALTRIGDENFEGLAETVNRHQMACDFRRSQVLNVAVEPWQLQEMRDVVPDYERAGSPVSLLDERETKVRVNSPTYIGSILNHGLSALVNPAQLAWELRRVAASLGVAVYEQSPVTAIEDAGNGIKVVTANGAITARRAVVATNAYAGPVRAVKRYVIPVYDHVMVTDPLTTEQRSSIGWEGGEGLGDWANQFHYYRMTADDRILWGGYDATYHYNNGIDPAYDQQDETHELLASQFFDTFPQLEGLHFSHRWGGPIASSTRFTAAWGTAHAGRVVWVAGYTGLGVGASRFGAQVALDLVDGKTTERTELEMVRKRPFPFPPEPLRSAGIAMTKRAMQKADRNEGKEGLWLKFLDLFGVGFDS